MDTIPTNCFGFDTTLHNEHCNLKEPYQFEVSGNDTYVRFDRKIPSAIVKITKDSDGYIQRWQYGSWLNKENLDYVPINRTLNVDTEEYGGLCFTAAEDNISIIITKEPLATSASLKISYGGDYWTEYNIGTPIILEYTGDKVFFKASEGGNSTFLRHKFQISGLVRASGDIQSLLDSTLAKKNVLRSCYKSLFEGCSGLLEAPSLGAETVGDLSYYLMFKGCTNLRKIPSIKAKTLDSSACVSMFEDCSSLKIEKEVLSSETLGTNCYSNMFKNATLVTEVNVSAKSGYDPTVNGRFDANREIKVNYV